MITCREMVDLLSDYVDGDLEPMVARQLAAHLRGCTDCTAFLRTFKGTQALVREAACEEMPEELKVRLRDFLRSNLQRGRSRSTN
ncbi:MAG: zf-HC2 domain-containing protein [candidate division NC10 bacterium]|nr:zf-HC2 domain-containing protein [candidate division NC10 bacterium]